MELRLIQPEPQFVRAPGPNSMLAVDTIQEAHGVVFLCPVCFLKNNGPVGTHRVVCWARDRGTPAEAAPKARWAMSGSCLDDLTLSPSVNLPGGCAWHGFVKNGKVT